MIRVKRLIELLRSLPSDAMVNAMVNAYEGEDAGLKIKGADGGYWWIRAIESDEEDSFTLPMDWPDGAARSSSNGKDNTTQSDSAASEWIQADNPPSDNRSVLVFRESFGMVEIGCYVDGWVVYYGHDGHRVDDVLFYAYINVPKKG